MPAHRPPPRPEQAAPAPPGCLFRFISLPLIIILAGVGFALFIAGHPISLPKPPPDRENGGVESSSTGGKDHTLAPFFSPQVLFWEEKILKWSEQMGLDPNLVATVMQIESCGDPMARSSAGAMGLFQVMPFHFKNGENPYHPGTNARRGLTYLKTAWGKGGSAKLALAGYNGGIQGAQRSPSSWPAETKRYVYWGTGIYADAKTGKTRSPRLEEWLANGGKGLCRQAQVRIDP